ncbi:MAG: 16S rRNA (cytosine(1402)-N(4))-methyltransferase RsmH [Candidatus Pacebacteria bacterium]|nr:16S rRNA (cytosine(1402)-N(4))-methyltransferase RsmH [Candidatus Paceibacterota bacterium]
MAGHQSVLLSEAIDSLQIAPDDIVVDATVGGAGHFSALRFALGSQGTLIGIDADSDAIDRGRDAAIGGPSDQGPKVILELDNFRNLEEILDKHHVEKVAKVLFDLGWSGYQLTRGRGFSFQSDEPLLMTYGDPGRQTTAEDVVNGATEDELMEMLFTLGEEQFARKIARGIVEARKQERITTTFQLVDVIKRSTPVWYQKRRLHPATKTFQALRIYVNDELGALREGLGTAIERVRPGGRIAVITFHSIEDRIVKLMFREAVSAGKGRLVTKKPIVPMEDELAENPRARSAKLRVFECTTI